MFRSNNEERFNVGAYARRVAAPPDAERIPAAHPGETLREDFLTPGGLTPYRLALETGLTQTHVGQLLRGERAVTPATALRLGAYLGTSAQFWLHLQMNYELEQEARKLAPDLLRIKPWRNAEDATRAETEDRRAPTCAVP